MIDDQLDLITVYKAPHMIAANMVKGLLDNSNIPAIVKSLQIPMYDDVAMMHSDVWGEILVPRKYQEEAERLIHDYLKTIEDEEE